MAREPKPVFITPFRENYETVRENYLQTPYPTSALLDTNPKFMTRCSSIPQIENKSRPSFTNFFSSQDNAIQCKILRPCQHPHIQTKCIKRLRKRRVKGCSLGSGVVVQTLKQKATQAESEGLQSWVRGCEKV